MAKRCQPFAIAGVKSQNMPRMKLLCFHPALAPYRLDFFNSLAECVDLRIVFLQNNLYSQKFDQSSLLKRLNAIYEYMRIRLRLLGRNVCLGHARIIRRENPNVLLGYESSQTTLSLLLYRFVHHRRGLKVWTSMDDSSDLILKRKGVRKVVRDFVLRNVDLVIVPSEDAKSAYLQAVPSVPASRYAVVPIVHDTASIRRNADLVYFNGRQWRHDNIPSRWRKVFIFVGRFAVVKNLEWLIEQVQGWDDSVGLVLVGSGEEEGKLRQIIANTKVEKKVIFAGRLEGESLYSVMSIADGLILCSHSETYGAVVGEALQWGTPCVVSRNCGASALINEGVNGCIFNYNDSASFKHAIARLPNRCADSLLTVSLRKSIERLIVSAG